MLIVYIPDANSYICRNTWGRKCQAINAECLTSKKTELPKIASIMIDWHILRQAITPVSRAVKSSRTQTTHAKAAALVTMFAKPRTLTSRYWCIRLSRLSLERHSRNCHCHSSNDSEDNCRGETHCEWGRDTGSDAFEEKCKEAACFYMIIFEILFA